MVTISRLGFVFAVLIAAPASVLLGLYRSLNFHPVRLPGDYRDEIIAVPKVRSDILKASEKIGGGILHFPEDLAYDEASGFLYLSCEDGWIRRMKFGNKEEVEDWAYVGGRPLGLAFGPDRTLFIANAYSGLMSVGKNKKVRTLSSEAEGLRFGLADGIDVAADGVVYFTDASSKYNLSIHMGDIMEGRPYGRLLSFDPSTSCTEVLLGGLYFPNGVSLSPDQDSVIFCESPLRRCKRYYIRGERKGTSENFIDALPGFPDNIKYDEEGRRFWIALATETSVSLRLIFRYPMLRKLTVVLNQLADYSHLLRKGGGVISVSREGEPLELYKDPQLSSITGALKIGRHLYYVSLASGHLSRFPMEEDSTKK